jgi:hypothetical protein
LTALVKLMTDSQRERKEEVAIAREATDYRKQISRESRLALFRHCRDVERRHFNAGAAFETGLGLRRWIFWALKAGKALERLDKSDQKKLSSLIS